MQLTVNGESMQLDAPMTVSGLIAKLGLSDAVCAAEVNKAVVPKAERDSTQLEEGDSVEIVTLVGGG